MALGDKEIIFISVFSTVGAIFFVCCFFRYCNCRGRSQNDEENGNVDVDGESGCDFGIGRHNDGADDSGCWSVGEIDWSTK